MASDESMTIISSSIQEDEYDDDDDDDDVDDWYHHHHQQQHPPNQSAHDPHPHPHPHLSRLSTMCSVNSEAYGGGHDFDDDDGDVDGGVDNSDVGSGHDSLIRRFMSRLSIDKFHGDDVPDPDDADADEEFSDHQGKEISCPWGGLSSESDSDKEPLGGCYSLPATPRRRRRNRNTTSEGNFNQQQLLKEYASENEVHKDFLGKNKLVRRRRRRMVKNRASSSTTTTTDAGLGLNINYSYKSFSISGGDWESEAGGGSVGGGGGGGLVVMTKPKGGSRSLCMDMEEVKACRDLGFELEHDLRTLNMSHSSRLSSISGSTNIDTASSGGNSPIANWRISSPGDDPRDVKARIRVWAQAVALASTSRHG